MASMRLVHVLSLILFTHTCFKGSKVLVTLYAIEQGASPLVVGALFATYSIFPVFLSIYAGQISDRLGARPPMLLGAWGLLVGIGLPFFFPTLMGLFLAATVIGICYIFFVVAIQHLVGTMGADDQRTRNYSYFSVVVGVTALTGPTMTGFLIEGVGHRSTFLVLALFPFIPAITLLLSKPWAPPSRTAQRPKPQKRPAELLRSQPFRRVLITAGILETGNELMNFLLPIYGHSVGLSPSQIGMVMGAYGAAVLSIRLLMPMLVRWSSEEWVLCGSMALAAMTCISFPFVTTFVPLMGIAFVMGTGLACGAPLSLVLIYNRAPAGRSGEAMGYRQLVNKATEVLVPLVFGTVSTVSGMLPVFWADALLLACGSILMRKDAASTQRQQRTTH